MKSVSEALQQEYQTRFEPNAEYRDAVWKILCKDFFSRYISSECTVLDLGAGWGEFSRNISAAKKYAMDLNPDCGERVEGHAEFLLQDCSTTWPFQDGTLDVVFTSNFLEHLLSKSAVELSLSEAFRCLRKGGVMICVGPNIRYLPGAYWDYWDHFIPISDVSMSEVLRLQGFRVMECVPRFLPYTMSGGNNPPLIALKIYLKLRFVWPVFGKQFLIVARKS